MRLTSTMGLSTLAQVRIVAWKRSYPPFAHRGLSAASAYENLEWINRLVAYTASIAEEKPNIKLIGELCHPYPGLICSHG